MAERSMRHWVEIGFTVLTPAERTARLPEDTTRVPYYARLKGFVVGEPAVGEETEVETVTGRRVRGEVLRIEPAYSHTFGRPTDELIEAGLEARRILAQTAGAPADAESSSQGG
jgi:hypothetical protein